MNSLKARCVVSIVCEFFAVFCQWYFIFLLWESKNQVYIYVTGTIHVKNVFHVLRYLYSYNIVPWQEDAMKIPGRNGNI